jgi:serine/threonine-protein kinase RsbW
VFRPNLHGDTEVTVTEFAQATYTRTGAPDDIELRLAAKLDHLPIIRSVAANIAIRADFDLDAIADLKLAVDEACSTVISHAVPGTTLSCRFGMYRAGIRFAVQARSVNRDEPSRDSFGWRVLSTLTDEVSTWVDADVSTADGHVLHVELTKRKTTGEE